MALPPVLSPEQRQAALEKAAIARRARAKLIVVLDAPPGVGKVKDRRAMEEIGISETRRVRGLGEQQRKSLLTQFG